MTDWSAQSLNTGYERVVIGFDVRVDPGARGVAPPQWEAFTGDRSTTPCSIGSTVWIRDEAELQSIRGFIEENGLSLLDTIPNLGMNACLIAIDAPLDIAIAVKNTFDLSFSPFAKLTTDKRNFAFGGFDIADMWTLDSALYSLNWHGEHLERVREATQGRISPLGLVEDETSAIALCRLFDELTPDQAPFAPLGIWISRAEMI